MPPSPEFPVVAGHRGKFCHEGQRREARVRNFVACARARCFLASALSPSRRLIPHTVSNLLLHCLDVKQQLDP